MKSAVKCLKLTRGNSRLPLYILGVIALLGYLFAVALVPVPVKAWVLGNDFYLGAYASPTYGGTVNVPPPDDPDLGTWSYIHSYTLTATATSGFVLSGWAGCPASWVNGNTVVVNPDKDTESKAFMLNAQGSITIYAYFQRTTVPITCLGVDGITWTNGGGLKGVAINEALNISVALTTAKAVLYEFAGWSCSHNVLHAIDDYMNTQGMPGLYRASPTYVTPTYDWSDEAYSWVKPVLRLKAPAVDNVTITWDGGDGGHFKYDNPVEVPVGTSVTQEWESDNAMIVFSHWTLVNATCTNTESYFTQFMGTAAGTATITCVTDNADFTTYYTVTVEKEGAGNTIPSPGVHTYLKGSTITLLAIPATGYELSRWEGLNGGQQSSALEVDQRVWVDEAVYRAVFTKKSFGGPGTPPTGPAATATGLWERISTSLNTVGLNNQMGRAFFLLGLMVLVMVAARNNKAMRVILPLCVLGVGIIGGWVPIWVVVLLAVGAGFSLIQFFKSKGGISGSDA